MTQLIPFTPAIAPSSPPFQSQATLDGNVYNFQVTWNPYSQCWYVDLIALDGTLVFHEPLIASDNPVPLAGLAWNADDAGTVTATTAAPHVLPLGVPVDLTISLAVPTAYNGLYRVVATGPTTFTYPLADDPGIATVVGSWGREMSLTAGYFGSTMAYFPFAAQFVVRP